MRLKVLLLTTVVAILSYVLAASLGESINKFAIKFYQQTTALTPGSSKIMSGLSVQLVLGLLSQGANGDTQKELNDGLFFPDSEFIRTEFKSAMATWRTIRGITLNIANKIFVANGVNLSPTFKGYAVDSFFSDVENVDFSNAEQAATTINTWVKSTTNDKITSIVQPPDVSGATLVLANAIYFKGSWQSKFDPKDTTQQDFYVGTNKTVKVDMMSGRKEIGYVSLPDLNAEAIELYYEGREASMVIIVPKENDGLSSLEQKLTSVNLKTDIFDKLKRTNKTVSIPKFKIETTIDLNAVLPKLGISLIFNPAKADLSGIIQEASQLYVSKAIQKAFIEVNEEGSEAAAVTAVIVGYSIQMPLIVNRPFIFVIKTTTGESLFIGRFTGGQISNGGNGNPVDKYAKLIKFCNEYPSRRKPWYCYLIQQSWLRRYLE